MSERILLERTLLKVGGVCVVDVAALVSVRTVVDHDDVFEVVENIIEVSVLILRGYINTF